ncbi:MAG TPA: ATP-binding protein [Cellvibrionaceae bacterium]
MNVAIVSHRVGELMMSVEPLTPESSVRQVADLFLSAEHRQLLCLPIVDGECVVGTISRYAIMKIFLQPYGREIFGTRPAVNFMNNKPLLIDTDTDIDMAARYVRTHISHPITEDFVILQNNCYLGMGLVLSLLEKMEHRADARNKTLRSVNARLKSSQAHLIQSEKMASLGQMVAGVAHEINTPLGYVQSNIELAVGISDDVHRLYQNTAQLIDTLHNNQAGDTDLAQAINPVADIIKKLRAENTLGDLQSLFNDSLHGLTQISELVVSLRNFSRIDHVKLSEVNINDCLDSALTIGRNIVKQKADVVRDYDDNVLVECAASQINQVLLNILTNAAQAIEQFGTITLKTRSRPQHVDIHIRDTGRGMSPEVCNKIFDPFFTTKAVGEGTGLGLSISFQIIEQHHGLINVKSIENKGTEFIIRLPRYQQQNRSRALPHE